MKGDKGATLVIGVAPPKKKGGDYAEDMGEDKDSDESFSGASTKMALRSMVKALGLNPGDVDMDRLTKSFHAAMMSYEGDEEGMGEG